MTTSEELRTLARAARFNRVDPSTFLERKQVHKAWPTERDLDRDGFGVWFGDPRDDAFVAALSPDVVLRLLDVVDAAEKLRSHEDPDIYAWQNREAALREALDRAVDALRVTPEEQT